MCLSFGFVVVDMLHDLRGKLGLFLDREEEKGPSKLYSFIEEGLEK